MHTDLRLLIQHEKDNSDSDWKNDYVELFEQINVGIRTIKMESLVEESDLLVFDLHIGDEVSSIVNIDINKDKIIKSLSPLEISEYMVRFLVHVSQLLRSKFSSREIRKVNIFADTFVAVFIPFNGGKSFNLHIIKDQQAGGELSNQMESVSVDI